MRIGGLAAQELGRHVRGRTDERAVGGALRDRADETEVADESAAVAVDEDVVGLDVTVHEAGRVGGAQAATGGDAQVDRTAAIVGREVACEAFAIDELHRDEQLVADGAGVVDGDDIRVAQSRHRAGLGAQARAPSAGDGFGCGRGQRIDELDRDRAFELGIASADDDAHATAADHALDDVATDRELGERIARAAEGERGDDLCRGSRGRDIDHERVHHRRGRDRRQLRAARHTRVEVMIDVHDGVELERTVDVRSDRLVAEAAVHRRGPYHAHRDTRGTFCSVTAAERVALLRGSVCAERRDEVDAIGGAVLERHAAEITAAWPALYLDHARYIERLAAAIDRRAAEPARRVIETMPAADLYLAAACMAGDPAALAAFRDQLVPDLRKALVALAIPPATIDEAIQRVLVMLFVGAHPQIAGYTGRGRLRSWLRSIGVRTARRLAGIEHGGSDGADELDDLPAAVGGPELDVLRARYADEVRAAFAAALAGLADRQRTVLRQYHLDGLTIDQLAGLYRINRATAARWVAAARLEVVAKTRAHLVATGGVAASEVDSIIRLVRSQLSVSLGKLS